MPQKVIESLSFTGIVAGGGYDKYQLSVSTRREGRKYYPQVHLSAPGGQHLGLNEAIPNASINSGYETPKGALDCGFKAAYFYLNALTGQTKLKSVEQASIYWVYLDESGRRVYDWDMDMSDEERKEWQNEPFPYNPPRGEGHFVEVEIGRSRDAISGEPSKDDGITAADTGMEEFLNTAGMAPLGTEE